MSFPRRNKAAAPAKLRVQAKPVTQTAVSRVIETLERDLSQRHPLIGVGALSIGPAHADYAKAYLLWQKAIIHAIEGIKAGKVTP